MSYANAYSDGLVVEASGGVAAAKLYKESDENGFRASEVINSCLLVMLCVGNLGNDHGFIIKEYYLHWYEAFWGRPKQSHESLCSKWTISYHCGESCSSNMVSKPCMSIESSNVEQKYCEPRRHSKK